MNYDAEFLRYLYRRMVSIRLFEEKVGELFLAGELPGFVHLYIGEEAIAVGVCASLTDRDYITSTHRGHGHCLAKGAQILPMMAEIYGKKAGYCKGKGGSMHIADFTVGMLGANGVVGGGYNLAVGAALAAKMRQTGQVAVCFFGDGASNRGTFHEGINMAAAWKLPVIFVNENNQWASTTPCHTTTAIENIADRAAGYGIPGVIVDGNDAFAVYETARQAVERARQGGGPTLIEAKTYRIKGHFVGDPEMYRTKAEVQKHFDENDPLKNFAKKVTAAKWLKQADLDAIQAAVAAEVAQAVEEARRAPYPEDGELFDDLYAEGGLK
ncbi:MAG TPA: thiamine pyrophosphate-dependent dehydrogenase E1 component subunit alpha [Selenomonadales bacterium]|nr:thiamine pyrophosphate-dependent dehydrogenase E1 component subunit alpha [Selenomonadales bacterium]